MRDVTECVGLGIWGKHDIVVVVVVDARRRKRIGPTTAVLVPVHFL